MKISRIQLYRYDIPFVRPFVTSQFTLQSRTGLILAGATGNEMIGLGEIAPLAGFSRETLDECIVAAKNLIRAIRDIDIPDTPESLRNWSNNYLNEPPAVVYGFESTYADLAARAAGKKIAKWYRKEANSHVAVNAVIAGPVVESEIRTKYERGFRTFKLKVGSMPVKGEIERIAELRRITGPDAGIRLDANRAYEATGALELIQAIEPYRIEYIEEPLRNAKLETLAQLRQQSSIPIAIDESLTEIYNYGIGQSVIPFLDSDVLESFDVAIVKPSLMGGIGRTIDFCERLIQAGKRVIVTSALDTGIGVTTALHIACALRLPDACGLDTGGVLESNLVDSPPAPSDGYLSLPDRSGLGIGLSIDPSLHHCLTELHVD